MATERLLEIAERGVELSLEGGVDQAQVAAFLVDSALTRFANSQIHQNVATKRGGVTIRVVSARRIGTVRVNSLDEKQIREAARRATRIARISPPNKDFKSLPKPSKWKPIRGTFDRKTAECDPDSRAEIVKEAITTAHAESRLVEAVAGSLSTGAYAFSVANSLGVSTWAQITQTSLNTTVISKSKGSQGFGSSEQHSRRIKDIDPKRTGNEAAEKSVSSINPRKIPTGDYEVVLSARAVASLLMFLGYIGFSAASYQDGQSFVKYNLKKQAFDPNLNVKDDPTDPKTWYAFPVDGEGVPKKRMHLIKKGRVSSSSICHNSFTAGREKRKKSTGHALPPMYGLYSRPIPFNIAVLPGDASVDEMISETKHGIFVTRFHYTNPLEPTKAILTGLTRDGTFLIKNGEITKPTMNLRYTDSMLSALRTIPLIGKSLEIVEEVTTPAMRLAKLRFTGITQF